MELFFQIMIVLEIIIMNMSVFYMNTTSKYTRSKTVMIILVYTILLIVFGYILLTQLSFFGNGNALFTMLGFLYLPVLNYLFEENYRDIFFIICYVWIYTLSIFSISFQIATIITIDNRFFILLISQTIIYFFTYRFVFRFVKDVYLKLLDCTDLEIRKYLNNAAFIWFSTIFIINLNFVFESVPTLKIISFVVILINVVFNYHLIHEILSKTNHIGILKNQIAEDTLTKVGSRIGFENFTSKKIKNKQRFALIYADLDSFKEVNDNYGHIMGDQYLIVFARELANHKDIDVFRISGDEFVAICAIEIYQDIINKIKKIDFKLNNNILFNGVSIGYSLYPSEAKDIDKLIHLADQRMYKDKQQKTSSR